MTGTALLAGQALAQWEAAGLGMLTGAALGIVLLAECVAMFYLIGFMAKSFAYLLTRGSGALRPAPCAPGLAAGLPEDASGVVILYLTAGDFDPAALDSLLRLRYPGPGKLVIHDDEQDAAARARIEAFLAAHPERPRWEAVIWHRPERRGGKAGAVNWVLERLEPRWTLLLLCDSDSVALDRDALAMAAPEFDDPRVAVVQFRNSGFTDPGAPALDTRMALSIDVFDAFASPQARWGYLPFFGHNALLRIDDLKRLGGFTPGFFSDDLDYSVRLTLAGRRIVYRPDLAFGERPPADCLAFRKRARKWALGCMQVIRARLAAVLTTPGIPFAHRLGMLEFMGFYPAQAVLLTGLLVSHLLLPWMVAPVNTGPLHRGAGFLVILALLAPTLAWCIRARRVTAWPALAWTCVLVYGGSILATARGVLDGLSPRERPWVPTNLAQVRPVIPAQGWAEAGLGLALILVPWLMGGTVLAFAASYLFAAVFLMSPLTFAVYREPVPPRVPKRTASTALARAAGAAIVYVTCFTSSPTSAGAAAVVRGDALIVDGAPFHVRGMHYSPWLPGTGPDGRGSYPGPKVVEHDLDRLRELGTNTVLLHAAPGWVIERARSRGMRTIYAFHLSWSDTSLSAFERQTRSVLQAIDSLRRHESVLLWVLGNEVPTWVVELLGPDVVERRLASLAARVRERDPGRLLAHANWPPTKDLDLSSFDVACFNLYPAWPYEVSVKGFGAYLREVLVPRAQGRPLLVTEFGINSLEAGETRQAEVLAECWREIERSPVVGGVVFEWCDEWWKNFDNPLPGRSYWERSWAPEDAGKHDADPEEHYGLVRSDRSPKPGLAAMREAWRGGAAKRSWVPWGVVGLLVVISVIVLGIPRRAVSRRATASPGTMIAAILLGFGLAIPAAAAGAPWTARDTLTGVNADDQFGCAVAGVGDVDGDGIGDAAMGARFSLVDLDTAAGSVYLYRAGRGAGSPPLVRLDGVTDHEHFGEWIAGGHDVDGDGLSDVAVGAPLREMAANPGTGAVDIFRGGALEGAPWARLDAEARDDWFGQCIALGDLDGDQRAEIIVGAPYNDRTSSAAGAVFVYRGGETLPATPWKVMTGEAANNHFGWSLAWLGDINGDGYGDFAVGARLFGNGPQSARGKVYLFHGGPQMDVVADGTWLGEFRDDWFGNSIAGPGDVDGGGRPDLLVGAPYNDRGGSAAGAAYLFRGEDPAGSPPAVVYEGESANAQLGWCVAGAGDANGDSRPDVLAGARLQDATGGPAAGRVYLYSGGMPLSNSPIAQADGEAPDDWLGNSVAGIPGIFGSARSAVAGGAPYHDTSGFAAGRVYLLGLGGVAAVMDDSSRPASIVVEPNPSVGRALLRWRGTLERQARFEILDASGRRVRVLDGSLGDAGWFTTWDGRDEAGRPAPAGVYWTRIAAGTNAVRPLPVSKAFVLLP